MQIIEMLLRLFPVFDVPRKIAEIAPWLVQYDWIITLLNIILIVSVGISTLKAARAETGTQKIEDMKQARLELIVLPIVLYILGANTWVIILGIIALWCILAPIYFVGCIVLRKNPFGTLEELWAMWH